MFLPNTFDFFFVRKVAPCYGQGGMTKVAMTPEEQLEDLQRRFQLLEGATWILEKLVDGRWIAGKLDSEQVNQCNKETQADIEDINGTLFGVFLVKLVMTVQGHPKSFGVDKLFRFLLVAFLKWLVQNNEQRKIPGRDVFGDTYFHNRAGVDFYLTYLHVAHMVDVPQHMGWGGDVTVLTTCTHGGCYCF